MQEWDIQNMATCSCRLRRKDYETLKAVCAINGKSVHEVVRLLVGKFLINLGIEVSKGLERAVKNEK